MRLFARLGTLETEGPNCPKFDFVGAILASMGRNEKADDRHSSGLAKKSKTSSADRLEVEPSASGSGNQDGDRGRQQQHQPVQASARGSHPPESRDNSATCTRAASGTAGPELTTSATARPPSALDSLSKNFALLTAELRQAQKAQDDKFAETINVIKLAFGQNQTTPSSISTTKRSKTTGYSRTADISLSDSEAESDAVGDSEGDEHPPRNKRFRRACPTVTNSEGEDEPAADLDDAIHQLVNESDDDSTADAGHDSDDLLDDYSKALQLEDKVGDAIQGPLATLLSNMLSKKVDEGALNQKGDQFPRPANVPEIVTPTVNPEIWGQIQKTTRSRDIKLQKVQGANIKGLSALAKLANTLMEAKKSKKAISTTECLRICLDAFALFAHANQEINQRRREVIKPDLNARFKDLAKNQPVTDKLFGDELSQQVKDINETAKMARSMAKGNSRSNPNKGKGLRHQSKNWGDSRRYQSGGSQYYSRNRYNDSRKYQSNNNNKSKQRSKASSQK